MAAEPVGVTKRPIHMDALRLTGIRPTMRRQRAGHALAAAACLFALLAVLAAPAGGSAHLIIAHHAVVTSVAADQSGQMRGSEPLAIAAPATVSARFVSTVPHVAAEPTSNHVPISSARTRGPPGTV